MRILVTGHGGLLAHAFEMNYAGATVNDFTNDTFHFHSRKSFDLLNSRQMKEVLNEVKPDVVINTAAYNHVELCETVGHQTSWEVNGSGVGVLAFLCYQRGIKLVHYGTDYVFDGEKAATYTEEDQPWPVNFYGCGKWRGEDSVLRFSEKNLVLRTSWLFGPHPTQRKSFVHTVEREIKYKGSMPAATDQISVPTFSLDLAQWTMALVRKKAHGLFHAVNDEPVSRFDWAREIAFQLGYERVILPVTANYFNSPMKRPANSALSNKKLSSFLDCKLGPWRQGLTKTLHSHEYGLDECRCK